MYGLLVFWMIYQALAILQASNYHQPSLRWEYVWMHFLEMP